MNKIELHQRKIIINGSIERVINSSDDALESLKSSSFGKTDTLTIGIYSLALLFMENPSDKQITVFIQNLTNFHPSLEELCYRIITNSETSNNKIENAIKEITKIALEISHNNE